MLSSATHGTATAGASAGNDKVFEGSRDPAPEQEPVAQPPPQEPQQQPQQHVPNRSLIQEDKLKNYHFPLQAPQQSQQLQQSGSNHGQDPQQQQQPIHGSNIGDNTYPHQHQQQGAHPVGLNATTAVPNSLHHHMQHTAMLHAQQQHVFVQQQQQHHFYPMQQAPHLNLYAQAQGNYGMAGNYGLAQPGLIPSAGGPVDQKQREGDRASDGLGTDPSKNNNDAPSPLPLLNEKMGADQGPMLTGLEGAFAPYTAAVQGEAAAEPAEPGSGEKRKWSASKSPARQSGSRKNKDTKWFEHLELLRQYKEEHGDCIVPRGYALNPRLASWVAEQRKQYKLYKDGKQSSITVDRIDQLNALEFAWHAQEAAWIRHMKDLKSFKERFGHCHVPLNHQLFPKLGLWVKEQRRHYALMKQGKPSHMTLERSSALERVGFCFDTHEASWLERLRQLATYKETYGDCLVPAGWKENPKLSTWVHHQRRQYKKWSVGKPSHINEERIKMLEDMGFCWNARSNDDKQGNEDDEADEEGGGAIGQVGADNNSRSELGAHDTQQQGRLPRTEERAEQLDMAAAAAAAAAAADDIAATASENEDPPDDSNDPSPSRKRVKIEL